jgi:hypothetical protein
MGLTPAPCILQNHLRCLHHPVDQHRTLGGMLHGLRPLRAAPLAAARNYARCALGSSHETNLGEALLQRKLIDGGAFPVRIVVKFDLLVE